MRKTLYILLYFLGTGLLQAQSDDKVFYSSFRPEGWDIHLSNDDGKSFTPFTSHESLDYDAKISPDGQWVVFTSERLGPPNLFIKHVQGDTLPRLLVKSQSMQDQVDFSPDGKWIAFLSTHEGNADIYKLPFNPSDTLDIAQAQNLTNNPGGDFRPKFSNDGNKIAFSSDREHDTKPHQFFPFAMQRTGDIFTVASEGGRATRLTNSDYWEGSPVWSLDDSEIFFYSGKDDILSLYKMSANGDNVESVIDFPYDCVSPSFGSDNKLLFTVINHETKAFSIMRLDLATSKIDSTLVQDIDMFNANYHPDGLMVIHGGKKPEETKENMSGFEGDLLVKNGAETVTLMDKSIELYGVRRAFAAPPAMDGMSIVYDHLPARGPQDLMTPFIYLLALIPLFALIWFVIGIIKSIRKRKTISPWKYLIFSILSLVVAAGIGGLLFYQFMVLNLPLNQVKWSMLLLCALLLLFVFVTRSKYKKQKSNGKTTAPLFRHYFLMLSINAAIVTYIISFVGSFFSVSPDFYAVDFRSKEVTHLFKFEPDSNMNPLLSRIIDTKFTPDGEYLQFTVGGFRANPSAQGAIYKFRMKEKKLERVTDFDSNNGFADFSKDNSSMVYRSGMSGEMDIYLKENEDIINLTNSADRENFPVISHDGSKIAFCSDVTGTDKGGIIKTVDIFLMERQPDNSWSEPQQLSRYTGQEGHPHFSPDGKWLIFTSEEFGINDEQPLVQTYIFSPQLYGEITAIRLEDGQKVRLTHNKWEDGAPLWINGN